MSAPSTHLSRASLYDAKMGSIPDARVSVRAFELHTDSSGAYAAYRVVSQLGAEEHAVWVRWKLVRAAAALSDASLLCTCCPLSVYARSLALYDMCRALSLVAAQGPR